MSRSVNPISPLASSAATSSAPALSMAQQAAVLAAAAEILTAAVHKRAVKIADPTWADASETSVMGCFVTAKRGEMLRGCCGFMGSPTSIAQAVQRAAVRTAGDDHRFPPISPSELPHLNLDVWLLFDPQPVTVRGEARREAVMIGQHGLQIVRGDNRGLLLPGVAVEHELDAEQFLQHVCRKAKLPPHAWKDDDAQLSTFAGLAIKGSMPASVEFAVPGVRPPAVAGKFYPSESAALDRLVEQLLAGPPIEKRQYPAIMVPHAGLKYSGKIAADVLRRVKFPSTVIVIGPKHTPYGVDWAVAPHETWSLPLGSLAGVTMPNNQELARKLVAAIQDLQLDAAAHAQEHAIEVELPLIARLAPNTKVVGIAIGRGDYAACRRFAAGLAKVVREQPEPPLLIISSDMNHFASDAENRRLDELALACIDRLDAESLLTTCRQQHISMCGVLPAVMVMESLRELGQLRGVERIAYGTSADVSGDKSRVVGYAGLIFA